MAGATQSATIVNQADAELISAGTTASTRIYSNEVVAETTATTNRGNSKGARIVPSLRFNSGPKFDKEDLEANEGDQIYLEATARDCNFDAATEQTVRITVSSELTGDVETIDALESGPDNGVFRTASLQTVNDEQQPTVPDDGTLDVLPDDTVTASVDGCGGGMAWDWLLIDPSGVVFDSQTELPVAGALVQLIDVTGAGNNGNAGGPALVLDYDGISSAPSTVVTGANGRFEFPLVAESSYRLIVTPPGDYEFPSKLLGSSPQTAQRNLTSHTLNATGSFGDAFQGTAQLGAVLFDVPLDSNPNGIFVQKTASRPSAGIAESIEYTVNVQNVSGLALAGVNVHDDMPTGFTYVAGTTRVDGAKRADPVGGKGPALTFSLPDLAADGTHTLTYRALIGPGALQGDGTNRAQVFTTRPAQKQSNVAAVTVQVDAGAFSDDSFILGKVFADCNENGIQDAGEPGVPGIRFYLEDGTFVVSDGAGKYSLYGIKPRTHVMKADRSTLPVGALLEALGQRNGGDGGSRFVDSKPGELHRADFAIRGCNASVRNAIEVRRATARADGEIVTGLKQELKVDGSTALGDVRALPASGIIGKTTIETKNPSRADVVESAVAAETLDTLLPSLDAELDFIGLRDGETLRQAQTNVRIKGRTDTNFSLTVNGREVPDSRVGKKLTSSQTQVEAREYIGVDLQSGDNVLEVTARDSFGNVRSRKAIHVMAPGELARIVVKPASEAVPADGESIMRIRVSLQDKRGLIVPARVPVTLETSEGEWLVADLDAGLPGTQTMMEGATDIELRAPAKPGTVELGANSGKLVGKASVDFAPQLRPMVAAGIIEGAFGMRRLDPGKLQPARADDGFERELTSLGDSNSGKNTGGARAALFLKGKVKGDYLLTLGYDSDKDSRQRLFRDIEPDKFYPVYGDSSVKGYDAQTTGHLYVRVDKNKSYLLAGDLNTQAISQARSLGAYNRSLTGIKEHYATDGTTVEVFASHSSERQIVQEIPANGTSGPYELSSANAVENGERVEIITRDRDQPAVVLSTLTLGRFSDYEIEPFTGRLLLRAPVASLDPNLNPRFIRVTYEVDDGGEEYWIAGADSQLKLTDHLSLSASVVDDRNPLQGMKLASTNATLRFGNGTTVVAEAARSDRETFNVGWGRRLELQQTEGALRARAFAGRTDESFNNPSALLTSGRTEAGAKASYSLNERTNLVGEALYSEDITNGDKRNGGLFGVERSLADNRKLEIGARHVHADPASTTVAPTDITSLRTRFTSPLPRISDISAFAEYEQDIQDFDRRMAAVGGEYALANRSRVYMRHEFITSLSGPYALDSTQRRNTTVFGLDTRYMQDDRVFSEYRIGNALGARESEAAIGLRNNWAIADGIRASTSLERIEVLSGPGNAENAAITGAVEYTRNPAWKGTARLELRGNDTSDGLLSTFGIARKVSDEWTFLTRNVYAVTDYKTREDRTQERLQFGFAYRDADTNRVNGLSRYEFRYEDNAYETNMRREIHVVSGHINHQVLKQLIVGAQYAAKYVAESSDMSEISSTAQMLGFRATRDLGKRWDTGVTARTLFSNELHTRQDSLGAEVGYLAAKSLWVSVGHNVTGFHDRDLSSGEYTNRGTYVRLRFKLDELLFDTGGLQ